MLFSCALMQFVCFEEYSHFGLFFFLTTKQIDNSVFFKPQMLVGWGWFDVLSWIDENTNHVKLYHLYFRGALGARKLHFTTKDMCIKLSYEAYYTTVTRSTKYTTKYSITSKEKNFPWQSCNSHQAANWLISVFPDRIIKLNEYRTLQIICRQRVT